MPTFEERLQEARRVHERGDAAGAVRLYAALNREFPGRARLLHPFGVALAQAGRLAEAAAHLERAADLAPDDADVRFDLGALRDAQGRPREAEAAFRRVVEIAPDHAQAWEAIGLYRRDAGDRAGAAEAAGRAAGGAPERLDLVLAAASTLAPSEAADRLVEALGRFPGDARLLLALAEALMRADRMEEAETVLATLRPLADDKALVGRHLGAVFARMGRLPDAAAALYDSLIRNPRDPAAWELLANVRDAVGDGDGAWAATERAVALRPDDLATIGNRARLQGHANRAEEGVRALDALPTAVRAQAEVRLLRGMLMPQIPESNEHIDALRARWMGAMEDVAARPTFVAEPWDKVALTGYHLGYHGREDRPLMEAYARATLASSPHLAHTARAMGSGEARLRVGFLSANLRHHSVGRVLIDLMAALDRERIEVVLLQLPAKRNGGQERAEAAADRTIRLEPFLEPARQAVEAARLDVLVYADLHMDPFADALSFSRLAPVQAATWGHPGTGGRAWLDYWVSCADWEPEGNERFYTEGLVRLRHAPYVTARPEAPRALDRPAMGLRDDARLYGCLQSPFKFHPDFDPILAGILAGDPKARLVLAEGPHYTWGEALRARFARSFDASRVDFLPPMAYPDYLAAVAACDVVLDPLHFGGANTSFDAFALGKPVVTLPGAQMRGRATLGMYRQMGYEAPVADSPEGYVDLAHRLAGDRAFAREAREAILAAHGALFDDPAPAADFGDWLEGVRRP